MGITSKDIAAQRAMLARGEEKRKADWRAAERERLRDTLAAAALTGLLSNIPRYQLGVIAVQAYDIADEMLRERLRNGATDGRETVQSDRPSGVSSAWAEAASQQLRERGHYGTSPRSTTHDAVPAAKAESDEARTDKAATSHRREGTGNTPSKAEVDALEYVVEEGRTASIDDYGILRSWLIRLRPEWESQSYEESDEKRVNTNTNRDTTRGEGSVRDEGTVGERLVERLSITQAMLDDNERLRAEIASLREAIRRLAEQDATLSVQGGSVTVTMDATLTDEEREAVEAAEAYMSAAGCRNTNVQATLRKLLERLT